MSTQPPPHTYRSAPTLPVSIGFDFLIFDSNELIWGQGVRPTHTDHKTLIGINISSLILKLLRKNIGSNDDMLQTSYGETASRPRHDRISRVGKTGAALVRLAKIFNFLIFDSNELTWGQGVWHTHTDRQTLIGINYSSFI